MFPTTLITGAAASGKTQAILDRIAQAIRIDPFAPIWVVLPNERQVASFQARLMAHFATPDRFGGGSGHTAIFNVACLNFYQLYGRLLSLTGLPQRRIADTTQRRLLRTVIRQLADQDNLTHFDRVASTPGFVQQVAEFIRELKQARITPEHFSQAARADHPQDADLGLIYALYQQTLVERDLVDTEGEGWLALARLREREARHSAVLLPVQLLIVDGFDQFTRVQSELLGLLDTYIPQIVISLTYQKEREETAHRRFAQTFHQLERFVNWQVEPVSARLDDPRPPILTHLSERLFEPPESAPPTLEADHTDSALVMIEAADPRREVEAALRLIKRALIDGQAPESIAIVARDLSLYRALLIDRAAAYGIPIAGEIGTRLIDNPAILSLLTVCDLAGRGFPRRTTIDVLRNPYLSLPTLDAAQVDQLDRISRQQIVIASEYQWLTAIRDFIPLKSDDADDEETVPVPDPSFDRDGLSAALSAFFAQVTPPETATPHEYALWIEQLIGDDPQADAVLDQGDPSADQPDTPSESGEANTEALSEPSISLNLIANIRAWGGDPAIAARDLDALALFKQALIDLLAAYDLLDENAPIGWDAFRSDLGSLTESTQMRGTDLLASGQILIGSVFAVRGLPLDSVYVLGLSEGQFPARDPEQTLYLDVERQAINKQLAADKVALNTHAERADEGGLFYELTALAHRTLTLIRPYSAPDGTPWPPSIYWTAVQDAVAVQPIHLSMNELVGIDEAASWPEAFMAAAHGLSQPMIPHPKSLSHQRGEGLPDQSNISSFPVIVGAGDKGLPDEWVDYPSPRWWERGLGGEGLMPFAVRSWLIDDPAHAPLWAHIERSRRIALNRLQGDRDEYNGYLASDLAQAAIGSALAPEHRWSAAQFNDYGACPYGFFAKRLLKIDPLEEPEPGLNAQVRGTLLHHILEDVYRQIAAEKLTITVANQARALVILSERAASIYERAPKKYGFRPDPLWKQAQADLLAELMRLITHDFSEHSQVAKLLTGERSPVAEEAAFQDAVSTGSAGVIILGGRIDRIDRSDAGLLVIDYKSGSTPFSEADIRDGRATQTLIYLHVVDQRNPDNQQPIYSAYWHTANRKTSGKLHSHTHADLIAEATAALHDRVIAMRNGIFPGQPSKITDGKCTAYCAFSGLCRVRAR